MIRFFSGAEEGQALVVVGAAMIVLVGALVLTVDWGYGLAMRRAMQNEADGVVLGVSRLLATSYGGTSPDFAPTTQENAWCAAHDVAVADSPGHPTATSETLEISFSADGVIFTTPISNVADCASIPNATDIPAGTRYVRARARASYDSLLGIVTRQHLEAAASSRALLTAAAVVRPQRPVPAPLLPPLGYVPYGTPGLGVSGSWTAPNAAIWPIAVRYRAFTTSSSRTVPVQLFWGGIHDNFFVTLAHFSPRDGAHELVTESDYTGTRNVHHFDHGTAPLVNSSPSSCSTPTWDTNGGPDLVAAAACDVPNWLNYGFRGSVSVGTGWNLTSWDAFRGPGRPAPQLTPPVGRVSCSLLPSWITAPSCPTDPVGRIQPSTVGDWLETVPQASLNLRAVHDRMISFIETYGRGVPGGDRAVVVNVFLWDCAQRYDPPWRLLVDGSGDCSGVDADDDTLDRLHVVAVLPMTIYESDVQIVGGGSELQVSAHWGGLFGDSGTCSTVPTPLGCDLNPLMNSAFLVPDD